MSQTTDGARHAAEVAATDAGSSTVDSPRQDERRRLRWRAHAALAITALVVLTVLLLLPVAARSLLIQLQTTGVAPAYDVLTGRALDPDRQAIAPLDVTYANFDISDIDEATRAATIIVSGNRLCQADCPDVTVTLYSLAAPGSFTRGMPPSATFAVPGQTGPISTTLKLPVAGMPQRYPFDTYTLLFGISGQGTTADGTVLPLTPDRLAATTEVTLSSVGRLQMAPPVLLDSAGMTPPGGSDRYLSVLRLTFTRPAYLQVLTVLLVLLITASGFFALFMRQLTDLSLGIGGIILGVWGIRSVVIQGNLPEVTIVDTLLAVVLLVLLLGLAIRATLHFWRQALATRREA
jgi:hypothetical protein